MHPRCGVGVHENGCDRSGGTSRADVLVARGAVPLPERGTSASGIVIVCGIVPGQKKCLPCRAAAPVNRLRLSPHDSRPRTGQRPPAVADTAF